MAKRKQDEQVDATLRRLEEDLGLVDGALRPLKGRKTWMGATIVDACKLYFLLVLIFITGKAYVLAQVSRRCVNHRRRARGFLFKNFFILVSKNLIGQTP